MKAFSFLLGWRGRVWCDRGGGGKWGSFILALLNKRSEVSSQTGDFGQRRAPVLHGMTFFDSSNTNIYAYFEVACVFLSVNRIPKCSPLSCRKGAPRCRFLCQSTWLEWVGRGPRVEPWPPWLEPSRRWVSNSVRKGISEKPLFGFRLLSIPFME